MAWNLKLSRSHEEPMGLIMINYPDSCSYWLGSNFEHDFICYVLLRGLEPYAIKKPRRTYGFNYEKLSSQL